MSFRIKRISKDFFRHIDKDSQEKGFKVDFDILYFCFMASLSAGGRKALDVPLSETSELIEYFPDRYRGNRGKLMIGLFLSQELKALGIQMDEKKDVNRIISEYIEPESPSTLSNEGFRQFNSYVYGGDEVLREWFDDQPRSLETFLRFFSEKCKAQSITKGNDTVTTFR